MEPLVSYYFARFASDNHFGTLVSFLTRPLTNLLSLFGIKELAWIAVFDNKKKENQIVYIHVFILFK